MTKLYPHKRSPLLDFQATDFDLSDTVRSMSNLCRYGGKVKKFYSVAQHSFLLSYVVPDPLKKAALIHDMTEGIMGVDLVRGIKLMAPALIKLEYDIMKVIAPIFGVTLQELDDLVPYDYSICINEALVLRDRVDPTLLSMGLPKLDVPVNPVGAEEAEAMMWARLYDLFPREVINEYRNNRVQGLR